MVKHPKGYLDPSCPYLDEQWQVAADDLPLEYFMNRFRLFEPAPKWEFEAFTGLELERVETMLTIAQTKEPIEDPATAGSSPPRPSLSQRAARTLYGRVNTGSLSCGKR